jgi:branched-chain amino acid transport system substrate-binding protein
LTSLHRLPLESLTFSLTPGDITMTLNSKSFNPSRRTLVVGGAAVAVAPAWMGIASAQTGNIKIGFPVPLTGAFSAEAQGRAAGA